MAAIPYHVAKAFLEHKKAQIGTSHSTGRSNFRSDGTTLYSYNLALAVWDKDGLTRLSSGKGYSVTTNRHSHALDVMIERMGIQVKEVK